MKISKVKELVLANELAIENDSTVEKLNEVLRYCFPYDEPSYGDEIFYMREDKFLTQWYADSTTKLPTIKVSEIELHKSFKDQVIELRKQYPNDFEFGGAVSKLLNE